MHKSVILGADHSGFKVKELMKQYFHSRKRVYEDVGAFVLRNEDSYAEYAFLLGQVVSSKLGGMGILLSDNPEGMCIAANKVSGIRAFVGKDIKQVRSARKQSAVNVLCLSSKTSIASMKKMIEVFLSSEFVSNITLLKSLKRIQYYEN